MNRLAFAIGLLAMGAAGWAEEPAVFKLPAEEDVCFKEYSYTGSQYFQFRADGTYRKIDREHMFVKESDHGTWLQDESGKLTLVSSEHYRDIESEPLSIFLWYTQAIERLPWVTDQINVMLADTGTQEFDAEQITSIEKYGYSNWLSRINVDHRVKRVPRKAMEELVVQIDRFLTSPEKNRFHVTPMTYKRVRFLLWEDDGTPINRDVGRIVSSIDDSKPDKPIPFIFTGIDREQFEKESGQTQEFIFYPEMTEKVRAAIAQTNAP